MTPRDQLLSADEVATWLKCPPKTVKYYVSTRQIPFVMIGKQAMFRESSIAGWLSEREVKPSFDLAKGV